MKDMNIIREMLWRGKINVLIEHPRGDIKNLGHITLKEKSLVKI